MSVHPVKSVSMLCKPFKRKAPAWMSDSPEHCDSSAPWKLSGLRRVRGIQGFRMRLDTRATPLTTFLWKLSRHRFSSQPVLSRNSNALNILTVIDLDKVVRYLHGAGTELIVFISFCQAVLSVVMDFVGSFDSVRGSPENHGAS
jgi:hypothetical protein